MKFVEVTVYTKDNTVTDSFLYDGEKDLESFEEMITTTDITVEMTVEKFISLSEKDSDVLIRYLRTITDNVV